MRLILIFLTILLFMTEPVNAMEVLIGRIVSVQPDKCVIVVDVSTTSEEKKLTVAIHKDTDFSKLKQNMLVRVWGDYNKTDKNTLFSASQICPAGVSDNDPTGVRKRLRQGHGASGGSGTGRQGWRHGSNSNRRH